MPFSSSLVPPQALALAFPFVILTGLPLHADFRAAACQPQLCCSSLVFTQALAQPLLVSFSQTWHCMHGFWRRCPLNPTLLR